MHADDAETVSKEATRLREGNAEKELGDVLGELDGPYLHNDGFTPRFTFQT